MKYSFKTSQQQTTWDDLVEVWTYADGMEFFVGGWIFDHFYPLGAEPSEPCMEAWTTASALAAVTDRLRIGHMVTSNTYRHPAVVANAIATVDIVSDGRLDFGFGAGWFEAEHDAYGIDLPPLTERFDRFDEAIEVIDGLLTDTRTTYQGEYYQLVDAYCEPKPVQRPRPPLVIGGKGEKRLLRTAAAWADHYNYPDSDIEDFRYRLDVLGEWCEKLGRDRAEIETSLQIKAKDIPEAVELARAAAELGADHAIFYIPPPHKPAALESLAAAVA